LKKGLLILFCFIYFCSSAGVSVNLHYCGGKLKGISLTHSDEAKCCGKKKMKNKNCCKERSIVYKVKDNQGSGNKIVFPSQNTELFFIPRYTLNNLIISDSNKPLAVLIDEPPDIKNSSSYLVNGVFRI
jgi:hypothetical protein